MRSHYDVIIGFKNGKEYRGSNVFAEGNCLYSYGRHFILAVRKADGSFLLNGDKYSLGWNRYSSSTSHHQSLTYGIFKKHPRVSFSACESAMGDHYWYDRVEVLDHTEDQYRDSYYSAEEGETFDDFKKTIPIGAEVHVYKDENNNIYRVSYHRIGQAVLRYGDRYFVCGMDEGSYFVSELPKPAKTIGKAFRILKPHAVQEAEKKGIEVKRQGEWFFIPQKKEDLPYHKVKDELKSHSLPHHPDSAAHTVTRIFKGKGRIFTKGFVRHSRHEHKPLNLGDQFHIAVKNTAIGNWSAQGNVD